MIRWQYIIVSFLCLIAGISIIETAYLGILGNHHTFRQADAYGYILGVLELKDFKLFDLFSARAPWGERAVFDLPVYEYLIAALSRLLGKDPLVATRYINVILWMITAFFGYRTTMAISNRFAGLVFVVLFATSPLFLYYFSAPLPDNLAIASSMVATTFLLSENRSWKTFAVALPFLAIASAVKSAVPFIFVLFSTCYILLTIIQFNKLNFSHKVWEELLPLAIFLIGILVISMLAEAYRGWLMVDVGSQAGHLWRWYFGSLDLRFDKEFWLVVESRFDGWQPPYFLVVFGLVTALFLLLDRNARAIIVLISACLAFFAGWLVFSNVYKVHDYYQLPVATVIFLSFSVMSASLIEMLEDRKWVSQSVTSVFRIILLLAFLYQLAMVDSPNKKERANFWVAVEYSLRQDDVFLYVANITNNPAIGGYVGTKFIGMSPQEFEADCNGHFKKYTAVLFNGLDSACLESVKHQSQYYVRSENKIFVKLER